MTKPRYSALPGVPAHQLAALDRAIRTAPDLARHEGHVIHPAIPPYLREWLESPVGKMLAEAKPHPSLDGPVHPALDPNNALGAGEK